MNNIGDLKFSVLASVAVACGFEPRSNLTKDDKIDIDA